jgi:hypothetical protein
MKSSNYRKVMHYNNQGTDTDKALQKKVRDHLAQLVFWDQLHANHPGPAYIYSVNLRLKSAEVASNEIVCCNSARK